MERGVLTTEFYFNVLVVVLSFILMLTGKLDTEWWAGITGGQAAAYTLGRSYRKAWVQEQEQDPFH